MLTKLKNKISSIAEKYKDIAYLERHPAILVYLSNKGIEWMEMISDVDKCIDMYFVKEEYVIWRSKLIEHVLKPLGIDFELLLPNRFEDLLLHLQNIDMAILLEVAENIWDIAYNNPIGSIRREGWDYVRYDVTSCHTEREWVMKNINKILDYPLFRFSYFEVILCVYWHKRLRVVRM